MKQYRHKLTPEPVASQQLAFLAERVDRRVAAVRADTAKEVSETRFSFRPRRDDPQMRVVIVAVVAGLVGVAVGLAVAEDPLPDTGCPELVAMTFIPRGTSGEAIIDRGMYVTSAIPCGLYEYGMVTDTSEIGGATLTRELVPGQEFNATDFVGLGPARPR